MLLTRVEAVGGKACPHHRRREGVLLGWHVSGTQEVESAINTKVVAKRAQAKAIAK